MAKTIEQQIAESQAKQAQAARETAALQLVGVQKVFDLVSDPALGELVKKLTALQPTVNPTSQEHIKNFLTLLVGGPQLMMTQIDALTKASTPPEEGDDPKFTPPA